MLLRGGRFRLASLKEDGESDSSASEGLSAVASWTVATGIVVMLGEALELPTGNFAAGETCERRGGGERFLLNGSNWLTLALYWFHLGF